MREIFNIKNVVIVGLIIIIVILRMCGTDTIIESPREKIVEHRTTDTLYIKGETDTVWFQKDHYIQVPIYIPVVDSSDTIPTFEYNNLYSDSLLTGVISTLVTAEGEMLNQELFYTPMFPKYITRIDTIKIKDSVYREITKYPDLKRHLLLHSGIGLSSSSSSLRVGLGLRTKKGSDWIYSYDLINQQHNVGITIPLTK